MLIHFSEFHDLRSDALEHVNMLSGIAVKFMKQFSEIDQKKVGRVWSDLITPSLHGSTRPRNTAQDSCTAELIRLSKAEDPSIRVHVPAALRHAGNDGTEALKTLGKDRAPAVIEPSRN